jgi:hypothetical protein
MNTNSSISLSPPYYKDYYVKLEEFGLARHHVQNNRCAIATTVLRKSNLFLILEITELETKRKSNLFLILEITELETNVVTVVAINYNNRTTTIPTFM